MPPRLREVACRGCGAMVSWVTIKLTQKRMPINPTASSEGRVFFHDGGWHVTSRTVQPPLAVSLFVPHFVTCPAAASFRKSGPSNASRGRR